MANVKGNVLPSMSKVSHRKFLWDEAGQFISMCLRNQSSIGEGKRYTAGAVGRIWEKNKSQPPTGVITMDAKGSVRRFPGPPQGGTAEDILRPTTNETMEETNITTATISGEPPDEAGPSGTTQWTVPPIPQASAQTKSRRRVVGGGGIKKKQKVLATVNAKRVADLEKIGAREQRKRKAVAVSRERAEEFNRRASTKHGIPCKKPGCRRILFSMSALASHRCDSGSNPFRSGKRPVESGSQSTVEKTMAGYKFTCEWWVLSG